MNGADRRLHSRDISMKYWPCQYTPHFDNYSLSTSNLVIRVPCPYLIIIPSIMESIFRYCTEKASLRIPSFLLAPTISDKTVETVTQIHLYFYTPLFTLPLPLPFPLSQCCWVLSYVLQYISDQDRATLSLGGGERAAFKRNVWISCWSTKNGALSQQVLSEIVVGTLGIFPAPLP